MARYEEIEIDQGSDVSIQLHTINQDQTKKDLTNTTVVSKMKKTHRSTTSTDFTAVVLDPATDGVIQMELTNAQTSALKAGRYVYDVKLSFVDSDGNTVIERILEGRITVNPGVS